MTAHQRLHVRVGTGRRDPFELPHFRSDFRRQCHLQFRQLGQNDVAGPLLMVRIPIAVQEPDGNAFDTLPLKVRHQLGHVILVNGQQNLTRRTQSFGDPKTQ